MTMKSAISIWWANGLYFPGQLYPTDIGDGALMPMFRSTRVLSMVRLTARL